MTSRFRFAMADRRAADIDAIDVWVVALDGPGPAAAAEVLSADEIARAERFVFDRDRRRFAACRRALRHVLSGYTGIAPEALVFAYGRNGKPSLDGSDDGLAFNVSHAEERAVIAVSGAGDLGVDIECTTRTVDFEGLADRFFSPVESSELRALPASGRRQAFYNCWTRKEAYIKATGDGLACPLQSFAVTLQAAAPPAFRWIEGDAAAQWRLFAFSPGPAYVGAAAIRAQVDTIRLHRFELPASARPVAAGAGAAGKGAA
jgi:4'-phosphopantetheinyl transferase